MIIDGTAKLAARRAGMTLSPRQLLIGLHAEGWITEAEATAWATSTALPASVEALIGGLPEAQRVAARITCLKMGVVERADPFVSALATIEGKTAAEIDTFFLTYAGV